MGEMYNILFNLINYQCFLIAITMILSCTENIFKTMQSVVFKPFMQIILQTYNNNTKFKKYNIMQGLKFNYNNIYN